MSSNLEQKANKPTCSQQILDSNSQKTFRIVGLKYGGNYLKQKISVFSNEL